MKNKLKYLLTCLVLLLFVSANEAQDAGLPKTFKDRVGEWKRQPILIKIIQEYFVAATFQGDTIAKVNQKSINAYKRLFASNAKVWDDLAVEPDYIPVADYAGNVYEYLEEEGVKTKFNEEYTYKVLLKKKEGWKRLYDKIDTTGNTFFYEIAIDKMVYYGIDEKRQIVEYPGGRLFELELVLRVSAHPEYARILEIRPRKKRELND
ncbi:MAG: hypothetical protein ACI85O_002153 [Saprospiraceae bacterium]|jgi:hypothetical protein